MWVAATVMLFGTSAVQATDAVGGEELAARAPYPLPFGVSGYYFAQNQKFEVETFLINGATFGIPREEIRARHELDERGAEIDAWLFPWLNVFATVASVNTHTSIALPELPLPIQFRIPFTGLEIRSDGVRYGGGLVVAGGTERHFASLTTAATRSDLSGPFDTTLETIAATARVGIQNDHGTVYAGVGFQDASERHEGRINFRAAGGVFIRVPFEAELSQQHDLNALVGGTLALGKSWNLRAEMGLGDRNHLDLELGYRF